MAEDAEAAWARVPVPLPPAGRTSPFQAGGRSLLLCNVDGTPYVVENRCPHVGTALEAGALRGSVLECPLHGGRLDVRDGRPVQAPIRRAAPSFAVRGRGDGLEVALPAAE